MGTNYYHRTNVCTCCGRYDERHICKSLYSFEAVVVDRDAEPWGSEVVVGSWQQWKERLRSTPGEVWDEYGVQLDVEAFVAMVEAEDRTAQSVRQYGALVDFYGAMPPPEDGGAWIDPDGFLFRGRSFS